MLIIHNLNKIQYKTLGKKNFYVERITEIFDIDPITSILSNHRYRIEITNRKYALAVFLDRMAVGIEQKNYYLHAVSGSPQWLTIGEIKNMDKFLDKIRLVGLG